MRDLEEARAWFSGDRFATETTGIELAAAGPDYARCVLVPDGRHLNARGFVMGGAIFTLADFTFAAASNSAESGCVSMSSSISYLNAVREGPLTAEARCLKSGRSTCTFEITVTDGAGRVAAVVVTTGMRVSNK